MSSIQIAEDLLPTSAPSQDHAEDHKTRHRRIVQGLWSFFLLTVIVYLTCQVENLIEEHDEEAPLVNKNFSRRGYFGGPDSRHGNLTGHFGWKFVTYIPSDLEVRWAHDVVPFARTADWSPLVAKYRDAALSVVEQSRGLTTPHQPYNFTVKEVNDQCRRYVADARSMHHKLNNNTHDTTCLDYADIQLNATLFSRFIYEFACLGAPCDPNNLLVNAPALGSQHTSYIEPLFGILRHPLNFITSDYLKYTNRLNKSYILVDKWALHNLGTRWRQKSKRSFLFDVGANTYHGQGDDSSQHWFFGLGDCMCAPFTESFLWERTERRVRDVWNQLPPKLHPHYHWYNYPLSVARGSWRNPLNHLLEKVDHGDVVTMKIDFDALEIEQQLINTILEDRDVSSRIDELFYEDHVVMAWMTQVWGVSRTSNRTAVDSLQTFRRLREAGIRAHSWV